MSNKENCLKCFKLYTNKTLIKNNGTCGLCAKSENKMSNNKKLKIPKKLKDSCWFTYIGDTTHGPCYSCNDTIKITNFHTGHILSEYDGGTIHITNLRPICSSCNLSSGVMNLNEFRKTLQPLNYVPMDTTNDD